MHKDKKYSASIRNWPKDDKPRENVKWKELICGRFS